MSNAVGSEIISHVVGYIMTGEDFATAGKNLPQRIALFGEANTANQTGITPAGVRVTSAQDAGEKFGFGSPIHMMTRILRPVGSPGIGGIPLIVYPQAEVFSSTASVNTITIVGTATANATHNLFIAGRKSVDGIGYDYSIETGDTEEDVALKIKDAVNANQNSPFIATSALGVVSLTSKWKGNTSADLKVRVSVNDIAAGLTYGVLQTVVGTGSPETILDSLNSFGNEWNTIVVNGFGIGNTDVLDTMCLFNGKPDPVSPTGRYQGVVMKPFIALTGHTKEEVNVSAYRNEVTIATCPAPLSEGTYWEAAANYAVLFARMSQDTPELDVQERLLPDMPLSVNGDIGVMSDFFERDRLVKEGNSTVDVLAGQYRIQDFITTFYPAGELIPQYRYCRNLMIDYIYKFRVYLAEQVNVVGKVILGDADTSNSPNVIKPKQWKAVLISVNKTMCDDGMCVDNGFTKDNTTVTLSSSNPDRLDSIFKYKRSGIARISASTSVAGFNYGTN